MKWVSKNVHKWMALVLLQGSAAAFFTLDVIYDVFREGLIIHNALELLATFTLLIGAVLGSLEIRRIRQLANQSEAGLKQAVASFSMMIKERFDQWALTPSERDVAMLLLKGFDTSEIAEIRSTAKGTVRVQLSKIFEKSGHSNQAQFVSSFVDVLIESPDQDSGSTKPKRVYFSIS